MSGFECIIFNNHLVKGNAMVLDYILNISPNIVAGHSW